MFACLRVEGVADRHPGGGSCFCPLGFAVDPAGVAAATAPNFAVDGLAALLVGYPQTESGIDEALAVEFSPLLRSEEQPAERFRFGPRDALANYQQ